MQATYQTRIEGNDEALSAYAALYGRVQRRLFAEDSSGRSTVSRSAASMKRGCVREYGIPARMFNAVRVSLEGKVSGARESQLLHAETLKGLVRRAGRELASAGKKDDRHRVHQKMRRLDNLRSRLARVEADAAAGLVRLCFGGRKLWRKQHHLEANGYGSHEEWLAGWRAARDGEFFVLGSRDETGGCQLCVAAIAGDGSLTLRLRMPDCLAGEHGKYVVIEGVKFAYGHEQVLAALQANLEFAECRRRDGEGAARATSLGQAISYRFKRDEKGWRMFVTTKMAPVPAAMDRRRGAIGVDLNADHLAETDASGNYLRAWRVPLPTSVSPTPRSTAGARIWESTSTNTSARWRGPAVANRGNQSGAAGMIDRARGANMLVPGAGLEPAGRNTAGGLLIPCVSQFRQPGMIEKRRVPAQVGGARLSSLKGEVINVIHSVGHQWRDDLKGISCNLPELIRTRQHGADDRQGLLDSQIKPVFSKFITDLGCGNEIRILGGPTPCVPFIPNFECRLHDHPRSLGSFNGVIAGIRRGWVEKCVNVSATPKYHAESLNRRLVQPQRVPFLLDLTLKFGAQVVSRLRPIGSPRIHHFASVIPDHLNTPVV